MALALVSCQRELEELSRVDESPVLFTASIDNGGDGSLGDTDDAADTKIQMTTRNNIYRYLLWEEDDKVCVGGREYTVSRGAGTSKAELRGSGAVAEDGKFKAYYPASLYNPASGELFLPQEYEYKSPVNGVVCASDFPMYGETPGGASTELSFVNLCALLHFSLTGSENVTRIEVVSPTLMLSGPFVVSDNPAIARTTGSSDEYKKVVLKCGSPGVTLSSTPTDFYIPVPPSYLNNKYYVYHTDVVVNVYGESDTLITTFTGSKGPIIRPGTIYDLQKGKYLSVWTDDHFYVFGQQTVPFTYTDSYKRSYTKNEKYAYDTGYNTESYHAIRVFDSYRAETVTFNIETNVGYTIDVESVPSGTTLDISSTEGDTSLGKTMHQVTMKFPENMTDEEKISHYTPKPFTINDKGDRVYFAPGNLLYQPSTKQWRLADRQYDYVGCNSRDLNGKRDINYEFGTIVNDNTGKLCLNDLKADPNSTDWIDIFAWGTSGYTNWPEGTYGESDPCVESVRPSYTYPVSTPGRFGPKGVHDELRGDFAMGDWGVANRSAINQYHGYPDSYDWRTLTFDELAYILWDRPNAGRRHKLVKLYMGTRNRRFRFTIRGKEDPSYMIHYDVTQHVPNLEGVLIFPDGFPDEHPDLYNTAGTWIYNWSEYEKAGCIFLPTTSSLDLTTSYTILNHGGSASRSYCDVWSNPPISYTYAGDFGEVFYWTSSKTDYKDWYVSGSSIKYYWSHHRIGVIGWAVYNSELWGRNSLVSHTHCANRYPVRLVRSCEGSDTEGYGNGGETDWFD